MKPRGRDDGNLMLLSGIVITIAFIMTALTLAQVSSLERQAATDQPVQIAGEWRFLHERLHSNINTSMTPEMRNDTWRDVVFPAIAETLRSVEAEKGYDVAIRLAGQPLAVNKTEADLVFANKYDAWSLDGGFRFDQPYDTVNDGLLWFAPCHDPAGPIAGCTGGVLVAVHLSNGASTIEEVVLLAVNWP